MGKYISSLIQDIYSLVGKRDGWFTEVLASDFGKEVSIRMVEQYNKNNKPTLRLSQMGPRCPRALWYSINCPEEAEELPPWANIKFSYGHVIEALVISLAKASGHEVTGEQDELVVGGVKGHRDCIIDGCLVDVKSTNTRSFQKFKDGSISKDDPFGYLDQLDGYLAGSCDDPLLQVKDRGYLLAVDKTLGHLALYEHRYRPDHIRKRIDRYKEIVSLPEAPACQCVTVPDGKSGNEKLDTKASYNIYKHVCFPGLRTFLYSDGPRYLTKVVRKPDVPEIDRYGKFIY